VSNPFDAPQAPPPASTPAGTFDVAQALRDGWQGLMDHGLLLIAVTIVAAIAYGFLTILCFVPVIIAGPILYWGQTRVTLDALDGRPEFETLFAGFSRFGDLWVPMFGVIAILFLIGLPPAIVGSIIQVTLELASDGDPSVSLLGSTITQGISLLWQFGLMCRFFPAPFLIVDQGMGATDAITEAWNLTATAWGQSAVLYIAVTVISIIGFFLCCVGVLPAGVIALVATASAYRQITGRA